MIKLYTQIRKWLDVEAAKIYPSLQIKECKVLDNGYYYDFSYNLFQFSIIIQNLKDMPKISWILNRELDSDELAYWENKYDVKLPDLDNYTKSIMNIDVQNKRDVKTIMSKRVNTMRIFLKDFKWILVMGKEVKYYA